MSVAVAVNWNVIKQNWSQDEDLMLQARAWGEEDATEGNDMRGSTYFTIESPAWEAYNRGYRSGLVILEELTGASDEISFMHHALNSMRASKKGCDTRHADPLSAGERIGLYEYENRGAW